MCEIFCLNLNERKLWDDVAFGRCVSRGCVVLVGAKASVQRFDLVRAKGVRGPVATRKRKSSFRLRTIVKPRNN